MVKNQKKKVKQTAVKKMKKDSVKQIAKSANAPQKPATKSRKGLIFKIVIGILLILFYCGWYITLKYYDKKCNICTCNSTSSCRIMGDIFSYFSDLGDLFFIILYIIGIFIFVLLSLYQKFKLKSCDLCHKTRLKLFFYMFVGLIFLVFSFRTIKVYDRFYNFDCGGCALKPIIYLYPEQKTDVSVKAIYPEKFTHTYPHYINGWFVEANPNGDLVDKTTGRNLYALYWEEKLPHKEVRPSEGFVIAGKDTISFFEEKLAKLGLTEREADEFIIYWLPKLEDEEYNFIRFQTKAEQDTNMPLLIEPKPDTVIRVMMEYDDLDEPIKVAEQILPPTPVRTGFTVVEWGGTELDID